MDVRCERCKAQYVFDDEQVTPSGLAVQCTNCGHLFKVKKKELVVTVAVKPGEIEGAPMPASAAAPRSSGHAPVEARSEPREWRVRSPGGSVRTCRELTTVQKWIVEAKIARDDEISVGGDTWKRLGDIEELGSFFAVVEQAERGRAMPFETPRAPARALPPPPSGFPPPALPLLPPGSIVQPRPASGAEPRPVPPARRGARVALVVALLAVAAGAAGAGAYQLVPGVRELIGGTVGKLLAGAIATESSAAVNPERSRGTTLTATTTTTPTPTATATATPTSTATATATPIPTPTSTATSTSTPTEVPTSLPASSGPDLAAVTPVVASAGAGSASTTAAPAPDGSPTAAPVETPARPRGPKALLAEAERLRGRGSYGRALELYGRVASDDPQNVAALIGRGLCYLDLSRYAPAAASFEAALKLVPSHADALLGLAEAYRAQGRDADAVRCYERYLAEHPDGEEAAVARNAIAELRR